MPLETFPEDLSQFAIKYGTKEHEIDANGLVQSLLHITTVMQETNRHFDPEAKLQIKIKATREGTFNIDLHLLIVTVATIIPVSDIQTIYKVVKTTVELFNFKRFLKSSEPARTTNSGDGSVTVENAYGDVTVINVETLNLYNDNDKIDRAVSGAFKTLKGDEEIDSLSFEDQSKKPFLEIPKQEFAALARPKPEPDTKTQTLLDRNARLAILKVDIGPENDYNWKYSYKGNKINAELADKEFLQKFENHDIQFGKSDTLRVELEVEQEFNSSYGLFADSGTYIIRKVIELIPGQKRISAFE